MSRKYFGTDGIRGRVGQFPITPEFCLRLGWAVGRVFSKAGNSNILIGKDTRISGYMLESVLESGLVSAGANVTLMGPMPTPAIAYLTRTFGADAGMVISASHNPYYDNGIKFFDRDGNKLPDETELAIEAELEGSMICVSSDQLGRAARLDDAAGRYIEFCKASIDRGIRLNDLRIVLDCAHGATYHIAPRVFEELGADIRVIGGSPDGTNINQDCGSTSPGELVERVLEYRADLGIAFDGDGDRVIMVDHAGEVVDGDELVYVIAGDRQKQARLGGGVVGTVMSNFGLERAFAEMGVPFERAKVGDRYVLQMLNERGWTLGGEASGHILCLDITTTGDAVISALQGVVAMLNSGRSLHELKQGMTKLPQKTVNVAVSDPHCVEHNESVKKAVERVSCSLADRGRVLIRPSGTEPVVRVMVEGEDVSEVGELANELAHVVETEAG